MQPVNAAVLSIDECLTMLAAAPPWSEEYGGAAVLPYLASIAAAHGVSVETLRLRLREMRCEKQYFLRRRARDVRDRSQAEEN